MCGIAGIINWNNAVDEQSLEKSAKTLQHRGPDATGIFVRKSVGFVHTRLSIVDLSGGDQPLHAADDSLHLIANGEIYNYVELRKESQFPFATHSDSECILQTYVEAGREGIKNLNGMFAFALYDERADTVILARDRLGIKPLFYAETANGLVFASEIKALLPLLAVSQDINPLALQQFLQNQFSTGRDTIFKGIKRVLPGEFLSVTAAGISYHQYWDAKGITTRNILMDEALDEFEALFAQVMTEHMRADVPFGLFLSGGIDSSVLLAELSALHSQKINTYSIGYSGTTMEDELDQAAALAETFGTQHQSIRVSRHDMFQRIVHTIWSADDLMRDPANLPTSLLSEVAAKDLKVVFSGEGGDEAFAGYRRFAPGLENEIKALLLGGGGIRASGNWSKFAKKQVFPVGFCNNAFREPLLKIWKTLPSSWSLMQKQQYLELNAALPDNLLVKADRMMMGFGLEGRVPFTDHRVVEFGLSLPDVLKYQNKRGKWLIRKWAEKKLPKAHLQRPKKGFYVPISEWMSGDFLRHLGDRLQHNRAIKEWFNIEGVANLLQAQKHGKNCTKEIWGLMQFAIWHRIFVESPGVIPSTQENPVDWI